MTDYHDLYNCYLVSACERDLDYPTSTLLHILSLYSQFARFSLHEQLRWARFWPSVYIGSNSSCLIRSPYGADKLEPRINNILSLNTSPRRSWPPRIISERDIWELDFTRIILHFPLASYLIIRMLSDSLRTNLKICFGCPGCSSL